MRPHKTNISTFKAYSCPGITTQIWFKHKHIFRFISLFFDTNDIGQIKKIKRHTCIFKSSWKFLFLLLHYKFSSSILYFAPRGYQPRLKTKRNEKPFCSDSRCCTCLEMHLDWRGNNFRYKVFAATKSRVNPDAGGFFLKFWSWYQCERSAMMAPVLYCATKASFHVFNFNDT